MKKATKEKTIDELKALKKEYSGTVVERDAEAAIPGRFSISSRTRS